MGAARQISEKPRNSMTMANREKSQRHDLGTTIACRRGATKIATLVGSAEQSTILLRCCYE